MQIKQLSFSLFFLLAPFANVYGDYLKRYFSIVGNTRARGGFG